MKKVVTALFAGLLVLGAPQVAQAGTTGIAFSESTPPWGGWAVTDVQTKSIANRAARVYVGSGAANAKICINSSTCGAITSNLGPGRTYSVAAPFGAGARVYLYLQNPNSSSSFSGSASGNWASN